MIEENAAERPSSITQSACAQMPSRFGDFRIFAFQCATDGQEYGAVVKGDIDGGISIPVRLHSECFTGDLMGSLRCDCRDQLEAALAYIGSAECGAVVYLRQEGRGIGLVNKVRAYALQDGGLDTVEANHALGFPDDLRQYNIAADILRELGVASIRLLSNNPSKRDGLRAAGITVEGLIPHRMTPNIHNAGYLQTKKLKSGHLL
ncbi:MAG: GTP cyclohydrolase II [Myxococcota bacterium]|jgi:GTP cyclohydrolase II